MADTQPILIDDGTPGVRVITLNRPQRLNALDGDTLDALHAALAESHAADSGVKAVIIQANGRAFCSGNDLKWLASGVLTDTAAHLRNQDRMQAVFELIENMDPIVIAAVHGHAVAGGFELVLAADIVVVAEDAQLGDAHLPRNFLPSGGSSQRLPRRLGLSRALYYLITGRTMSGVEAERNGLAALAVPQDVLAQAAMNLAAEIARVERGALSAMKKLARRALELPLQDGLALERWSQFRFRNESPSLHASVMAFAAGNESSEQEKT